MISSVNNYKKFSQMQNSVDQYKCKRSPTQCPQYQPDASWLQRHRPMCCQGGHDTAPTMCTSGPNKGSPLRRVNSLCHPHYKEHKWHLNSHSSIALRVRHQPCSFFRESCHWSTRLPAIGYYTTQQAQLFTITLVHRRSNVFFPGLIAAFFLPLWSLILHLTPAVLLVE